MHEGHGLGRPVLLKFFTIAAVVLVLSAATFVSVAYADEGTDSSPPIDSSACDSESNSGQTDPSSPNSENCSSNSSEPTPEPDSSAEAVCEVGSAEDPSGGDCAPQPEDAPPADSSNGEKDPATGSQDDEITADDDAEDPEDSETEQPADDDGTTGDSAEDVTEAVSTGEEDSVTAEGTSSAEVDKETAEPAFDTIAESDADVGASSEVNDTEADPVETESILSIDTDVSVAPPKLDFDSAAEDGVSSLIASPEPVLAEVEAEVISASPDSSEMITAEEPVELSTPEPAPDPQFCPNGTTPGSADCTTTQYTGPTAIADAINDATVAGIIYLEEGSTFTETINLSGQSTALTFSGGWNFTSNIQGTTTTLNAPINIIDSSGTIRFENLIFGADASFVLDNAASVIIDSPGASNLNVAVNGTSPSGLTVIGGVGNDTLIVTGDALANDLSISTTEFETVSIQMNAGDDNITVNSTLGASIFQVDGGADTDVLVLYDVVTDIQNIETLDVLGLFNVTIPLAINALTNQTVSVWDGASNADVFVNILTVGAHDISAFFGIGDGTPGSIGLDLTGVDFALALLQDVDDAARHWLSLLASSTGISFVGIPGLTLLSGAIRVEVNRKASDGTVVDYTPNNLSVTTDASNSLDLDMAGEDGELLAASGDLNIGVTDFVNLSGTIGFAKKDSDLIAVGDKVTAKLEAVSSNVTLSDANFGLQVIGEKVAFELSNGTFSTSISDLKNPEVTNLFVQYTSATASVTAGTTLTVGSVSYTYENDISSGTMTFAGNIKANLFDIFKIDGGFAVQRKTGQDIVLSSAATVTADLLTIGMANVIVFTGYDGIGLELIDVDLAIALWSEVGGSGRSWTSVMGNVDSAAFVGIDILTLSAAGISILVNKKASDDTVVDYIQDSGETAVTDLIVTVGPSETVEFKINDDLGSIVRVAVDNATLGIDGFFYITGSFGFEKSSGYALDIQTGLNETIVNNNSTLKAKLDKVAGIDTATYATITDLSMDSILLGMSEVSIFVGGDSSESALFSVEKISFGLGLFTSRESADPDRAVPMMYSLKASKEFTPTLDIDLEVLRITLEEVIFRLNGGNNWQGLTVSPYINFAGGSVSVPTGAGLVELDFTTAVIGVELVNPSLNIADFVYVSAGSLLIEHRTGQVDVVTGLTSSTVGSAATGLSNVSGFDPDDYSRIDDLSVNINVLAATDVNIFIGGTTSDDALISLIQISFGLAIIKSTKAADPSQVVPTMFALSANWDSPFDIDYAGLVIKVGNLGVAVNKGSAWKTGQQNPPSPFVDWISSFPDDGMDLTTDGSLKADFDHGMIRVEASYALVSLFDFFYLKFDNFFIEKGTGWTVSGSTGLNLASAIELGLESLNTNEYVSDDYETFTGLPVESLVFGGENIQLFVGYGPYYVDSNGDGVIDDSDTPSVDAIGFVISGLDFGLVILKDPKKIFPTMFALKGIATGVAVVGLDFLTLSAGSIEVALNMGNKWKSDKGNRPFVDWTTSPSFSADGGYQITSSIKFDFTQETIKLAITDGKLCILDVLYLQGSFAFEKGARYTATIKNDTGSGAASIDVEVDAITLGGQDLSAFFGMGSMDEEGQPTDGSVGLSIQNLTFGLGLFKPTDLSLLPEKFRDKAIFIALNAHVDFAGFVGLDSIATVNVWDVTLQLNTLVVKIGGRPIPLPMYIDFQTTFETTPGEKDGVFEIPTGADPVVIDYNTWVIRASIGFFTMRIAGNVYLAGSMALDIGKQVTVTLSDGTTQDVMVMSVAASGVYGFLGFNGPYIEDTNGDHIIDQSEIDSPNTSAVGFALNNLNLAIIVMVALPFTEAKVFFAVQASLTDLSLVGIPEVTASADNLLVNINMAAGFTDPTVVVDFAASFPAELADEDGDGILNEPAGYQVPTGAAPVYIAFDSFLIEAEGTVKINVADSLFFDGVIKIKITDSELSLMVNVAFELKIGDASLLSGMASGTIGISDAGMFAYVALSVSVNSFPGFSMDGIFHFEINTTSDPQDIQRYQVDENGDVVYVNGDPILEEYTIPAGPFMYVYMSGKLTLGYVFVVEGSVKITFSATELTVEILGSMDLAGFGSVNVDGSAGIYDEGGIPVFAGKIDVSIEFNFLIFYIAGNGTFQVNTSTTETHFGVAPNSFLISVTAEAEIKVILHLSGTFTISYQDGLFRIALTDVDLNFFNVLSIKINGWIQSDGQYDIYGSAGFGLDLYVVGFDANIYVHVWHETSGKYSSPTGFSLHLSGRVFIDLGIVAASAGIDAELEVTESYVKVALSLSLQVKIRLIFVTIRFSVGFSWSHYWSWGAPPVIARQEGDTVYLNFGVDGWRRGSVYENATTDSVVIVPYGTNGITVYSMGTQMHFNAVNHIIVTDFQEGDDYLIVDSGVKADLEVRGGEGDDTILYYGESTATLYGDAGDDSFLYGYSGPNGTGEATLDGGAGDDIYYFADGFGQDVVIEGPDDGNDTLDFSGVTDTGLTFTFDGTTYTVGDGTNLVTTDNNVENFIGTAQDDDFVFQDDDVVPGNVTGGLAQMDESGTVTHDSGTDTLDFSDYGSTRHFILTALGTDDGFKGTVNGIGGTFDNINVLVGTTAYVDSLQGLDANAEFDIHESDIEYTSGGRALDTFSIENLYGGGGDDDFVFDDGVALSGAIDGGSGTGDTLDYSAYSTPVDIDLSLAIGTATNVSDGVSGIENLTGGSADDILVGDGNANVITGNGGDDTMQGGGGNDTYLFGNGWGNDTVRDASGVDTLDFGAVTNVDNLTVDLDGLNVTDGVNQVDFTGIDVIHGGQGDDLFEIDGTQTYDLHGGAGDDDFVFDDGAVLTGAIDGGSGTGDTLDYSAYSTPVDIDLSPGIGTSTNVSDGVSGIENLIGGSADDILVGDGNANVITGNGGDDTMRGGDGNDTYLFGNGWGNDTVTDASGVDTLDFSAVTNVDNLTVDLDGLNVTDGVNQVDFTGIDVIHGGQGDDLFEIDGTQTYDLYGGAGDDDFVFLNDAVVLGNVNGGLGTDTLDFSDCGGARNFVLTALGTDDGFKGTVNGIGGTFDNIDVLVGTTAGDDSLQGLDANAEFDIHESDIEYTSGGRTLDTFGIENLYGGGGDDDFVFDDGVALSGAIDGGSGTGDTLDYSAYSTPVCANLGAADVTVGATTCAAGCVTAVSGSVANIENLTGGSADDILIGDANVNAITGNGGDDTMQGGGGNDTYLFGNGWGNDTVRDAFGVDTLDFGAVTNVDNLTVDLDGLNVTDGVNQVDFTGIDVIHGGQGDDLFEIDGTQTYDLYGGAGDDDFVFDDGAVLTGAIDGGSGTGDTLDFSAYGGARSFVLTALGTDDGFKGTVNGIGGTFDNIDVLVGTTADDDSLQGLDANAEFDIHESDIEYTSGGRTLDTFGIENLYGGDQSDSFVFDDGAVLTGTIDGGLGTGDTLDYSAYSTPRSVVLIGPGVINGFDGYESAVQSFVNINNLTGTGGDSLTGTNQNSMWTLDTTTQYQAGGAVLDFSGFNQLNGGSSQDIFEFWNTAIFDGNIDGRTGSDLMDYSNFMSSVNVDLQSANATGLTGIFAGIDALTGSPQVDTFSGQNLPATFEIDGSDRYIGAAVTLDLSAFEILVGGSAADSFQIQNNSTYDLLGSGGNDSFVLADGVTLTGTVDGGTGLDKLDLGAWTSDLTALLTALGTNSGFDGSVEGLSSGFASLDRLVGGSSPADSLTGLNAEAVWHLNLVGDNTYTSSWHTLYFVDFHNLGGGSGADTFSFADGLLFDGSLDGGNGSDTLNYSNFTTPVIVDLGTGIVTGLTGLAINFENATGGRGADTLVGNDLDNILDGGPGDDTLSGLGGDDTLITGTGNNILFGGDGYDTGIIHYNGTYLIPLNDVENLMFLKRPAGPTPRPLICLVIEVLSGQEIDFSDFIADFLILRLPEGNSVQFSTQCCDEASLDALIGPGFVPGAVEPGIAPIFGMRVNAWQSGQALEYLRGAMLISFRVPDWMRGLELAIVHWDAGSLSWVELDTYLTPDGRWAKTISRRTGIFLLVVNGLEQSLDCSGQAVLTLPNGLRLSLPCGLADLASIAPLVAWQLPGVLSAGLEFASAAQVWVLQGGTDLPEAGLDISFPIPDLYPADELVILHWHAGAWTELPATVIDGRLEAHGTRTGHYALAVRSSGVSLACEAGSVRANAGSAHVTASCSTSGELTLKAELPETLQGPLYEGDRLLGGVTVDLPSGTPFLLDFDHTAGSQITNILRYDASLYDGVGGWVSVAEGNSVELDQPGTYILVSH